MLLNLDGFDARGNVKVINGHKSTGYV